ncbi:hypothetical protein [Sinosporangium siamense]|uniref:Uncharacterized protein n=1 Tax=Sinosporangium siamense TaxID=1367973 RepID=A0A919V5N1_9ACTN|nr:hypothetical protein [Sinosporangium siamense]GII90092.1 hypothetical protein Ssi02_03230 [Sinosporangium siamense]
MRFNKLAPMAATAGVALALLAPPAASATQTSAGGATTASASAASTATSATAAVNRASVACSSPRGKRANYSWGNGNTSTTIYFNNHCSHKVSVTITFQSYMAPIRKCMTVNPKTQGKKKWQFGKVLRFAKGC